MPVSFRPFATEQNEPEMEQGLEFNTRCYREEVGPPSLWERVGVWSPASSTRMLVPHCRTRSQPDPFDLQGLWR